VGVEDDVRRGVGVEDNVRRETESVGLFEDTPSTACFIHILFDE
jgi:hypothetical protein